MDCSRSGLPVHHQPLEFTQTHVHWVGDAIQPSHPLWSSSPPAFNISQHQGLPCVLPFFVIWWFSIVVCFDSFIFIFCISSIGFCFVVPCSLPKTSYSYSRVFWGDNILPLHVKKFNIFTLSSNILFLISQFASFYCIYKQIIVVNTIKRKWQKVKKN